MLIFERSKPEFLLVDDSSHVISECPRAPGNRAFLCHCGLQWRRTNRNHISIKCSRKLLFDSQIESPRSAFSARRPTTTLAWRLGTRVSSQPRKSRCSMSKPVNFPVNICHNNSLKLVQENSGKPSVWTPDYDKCTCKVISMWHIIIFSKTRRWIVLLNFHLTGSYSTLECERLTKTFSRPPVPRPTLAVNNPVILLLQNFQEI